MELASYITPKNSPMVSNNIISMANQGRRSWRLFQVIFVSMNF